MVVLVVVEAFDLGEVVDGEEEAVAFLEVVAEEHCVDSHYS
jgi:hypothetical protein